MTNGRDRPALVEPAPTAKGWWRRNTWGLIAVIPLFAIAAGLVFIDPAYRFWNNRASQPVSPGEGSWVSLPGVRLRLGGFDAITLLDFRKKPVSLPPDTMAWRAVIEFQVDDEQVARGCKVQLEDAAGALYGVQPAEMSRARVNDVGLPCAPKDPGQGKLTRYSTPVYFVLPADAEPVAIRVIWRSQNPRFARLTL